MMKRNIFFRIPVLLVLPFLGSSLSGCAQSALLDGLGGDVSNSTQQAKRSGNTSNELAKATSYWGMQFAKNPRNPDFALNYARNLKAMKQNARALAVLRQASKMHPGNRIITSELGRLAAASGHDKIAGQLLTRSANASDWKGISARGALAARKGQYKQAQSLFNKALELSPGRASIVNNLALAYALDGQADKGEVLLREVVAKGKATAKVRQNLSLILGLQGKFDEAKDITSTDLPVTLASANDDYMRNMMGMPQGQSRSAKHYAGGTGWATKTQSTPGANRTGTRTARARRDTGNPVMLQPSGQ